MEILKPRRCKRCKSPVAVGLDSWTCPRCGVLPAGIFDPDPTEVDTDAGLLSGSEDLVTKRVRELLNELHHKCGYRTDMIEEIAEYIRAKLAEDAKRPSY